MSISDILILSLISKYALPLLTILAFLVIVATNFKRIKMKIFSKFLVDFENIYDSILREQKKELFSSLHSITSHDWKLRNEGLIRILEIGVRTGENLKYYPKNSHVILVDKNVHMESYFKKNPWKVSHLHVERYMVCHTDELEDIPDNCVDAVIATLVLCNTANIQKVLKQIQRVLAPGGRYYFIEHVHEKSAVKLGYLQSFLSLSGIWPGLFDGCCLNRETARFIDKCGFQTVSYDYMPVKSEQLPLLKFMRMHILGIATK